MKIENFQNVNHNFTLTLLLIYIELYFSGRIQRNNILNRLYIYCLCWFFLNILLQRITEKTKK